jgi:dienelactone hydrolase
MRLPVSDRPVLIPTPEGPVGGIVSAPDGAARAAIMLLPGWGHPARSGTNSFWTRIARELGARGIVALRFDYSREGETLPLGEGGSGQLWKRDLDLRLTVEVERWLRERVGEVPLFLVGACSGGRIAIELAGERPDEIAGSFLVVPYLRVLGQPAGEAGVEDDGAVDPFVTQCLLESLRHSPTAVLVGERDSEDLPSLQRRLAVAARDLECDVVPDVALHFLDQPNIQAATRRWLLSRIEGVLKA